LYKNSLTIFLILATFDLNH